MFFLSYPSYFDLLPAAPNFQICEILAWALFGNTILLGRVWDIVKKSMLRGPNISEVHPSRKYGGVVIITLFYNAVLQKEYPLEQGITLSFIIPKGQ